MRGGFLLTGGSSMTIFVRISNKKLSIVVIVINFSKNKTSLFQSGCSDFYTYTGSKRKMRWKSIMRYVYECMKWNKYMNTYLD